MPPASGIIADNSPNESAPAMVSAPATAHATSSQPGLPMLRAISAETMKIPEPIMTPATIMVESNNPNPRENSWLSGIGSESVFKKGNSLFLVAGWILYTYDRQFTQANTS